jgi:hypothetical protein
VLRSRNPKKTFALVNDALILVKRSPNNMRLIGTRKEKAPK